MRTPHKIAGLVAGVTTAVLVGSVVASASSAQAGPGVPTTMCQVADAVGVDFVKDCESHDPTS
jgi:hypothetical protein